MMTNTVGLIYGQKVIQRRIATDEFQNAWRRQFTLDFGLHVIEGKESDSGQKFKKTRHAEYSETL